MKDLKQLHHEFVLAKAAFRSAARSQGWERLEVGNDDQESQFWLPKDEYQKVSEMLQDNIGAESYCLDLCSKGEAFAEY